METTVPKIPDQGRPGQTYATAAIVMPAVVALVAHLLTTTGYGLSGDELYAIACSDHPAAGYVDLGPIPVLLLALQRLIGGNAFFTLRCVSALLASFTVYFSGRIAWSFGAGPYGQFLAALCALVAPALLFAGHVATPFGFAVLAWTIGTYLILRIAEESTARRWLLLGVTIGAGLLSSFAMVFFVGAAVIGFLLTPLRRHLRTLWPWAAMAVAVILMVPWIIWQASHAWPTLAWVRTASAAASGMQPFTFVMDQIKLRQPLTLPLWLSGVIALFFAASFRRWQVIAWIYVITAIALFAAHMEPQYLIPATIGLFAAGSVLAERVLRKTWMRVAVAVVLFGAGLSTLPMGIPVLAPRAFIEYEKATGLRMSMGSSECTDRMPGYYGTMFGRKELAVVMNAVFTTLPPEERGRYGILCESAVQAAALRYYGKDFTIPPAVSGNDQFWYWGPGEYTGDRLVVVGGNAAGLQGRFGDVNLRMRYRDEYLHPGNSMTPVWLVGRPVTPLPQVWDQLRTMK